MTKNPLLSPLSPADSLQLLRFGQPVPTAHADTFCLSAPFDRTRSEREYIQGKVRIEGMRQPLAYIDDQVRVQICLDVKARCCFGIYLSCLSQFRFVA